MKNKILYENLKKENLRDNMTDIELVLNMLAEVTTTAISKQEKPDTFYKTNRLQFVAARPPKAQEKVWKKNSANL